MKKQKALVTSLLAILMMFAMAMTASAASSKAAALKAYKNFLSQKETRIKIGYGNALNWKIKDMTKAKFDLIYLNDDNIPELVVKMNGKRISCPDEEELTIMYTYNKKMVLFSWDIFRRGRSYRTSFQYYPKTSVFMTVFDSKNHYLSKQQKYNLSLESTVSLGEKANGKYLIKNKVTNSRDTVSEKTYKKMLKKHVGKTKRVKLKLKNNTEGNRKKYMK